MPVLIRNRIGLTVRNQMSRLCSTSCRKRRSFPSLSGFTRRGFLAAGFAGTTVSGDAGIGVFSLFRKVIVRFNMVDILQNAHKAAVDQESSGKTSTFEATERILAPFERVRQNYQEPQLSRK
ncbi:hypothetical protein [Phyllobacterium zundukense]|uniref:Uncharacterized protein n=1 Tax=Phyllobacterium zundukense TaxID=1867719 RepID=A0ACD4D555_9HYPH|nr:hypothetical protein [Phyllobacterium zundukense]UXN61028.1 hypothetical protein N8E88_13055 [Phyllobacterium zundukense]